MGKDGAGAVSFSRFHVISPRREIVEKKDTPEEKWEGSLKILDPREVKIARGETGVLEFCRQEEPPVRVHAVLLFPLTDPEHYISIQDHEEKEIGVIENLRDLPRAAQDALREEFRSRYLVPVIKDVKEIASGFGVHTWTVVTERGERVFHVRGRTRNIQFLGGGRLIITDLENCRYEIPDYRRLPHRARLHLSKIL